MVRAFVTLAAAAFAVLLSHLAHAELRHVDGRASSAATAAWFANDPILRACCDIADCKPVQATYDGASWVFRGPGGTVNAVAADGREFPARSDPPNFWACFHDDGTVRSIFVGAEQRPCFFKPDTGI